MKRKLQFNIQKRIFNNQTVIFNVETIVLKKLIQFNRKLIYKENLREYEKIAKFRFYSTEINSRNNLKNNELLNSNPSSPESESLKSKSNYSYFKLILLFPILYLLYFILEIFFPLFLQNYTLKLEVNSDDPSFQWFMNWLSQLNYSKACTHLSIYSLRNSNYQWFLHFDQTEETSKKDILLDKNPSLITDDELLVPAPGTHIFKFNGSWIYLHYDKDTKNSSQQKSKETITLWVLNSNRNFLMNLILDARSTFENQRKNKTCIYMPDFHLLSWEEVDRKEPRPIQTVFLKHGQMEAICKDLNTFRGRKQFYKSKGIPYRRGYLLYGVPGSGKTSTVMSLAGQYGYHICLLNVGASGMNDESLQRLMLKAPKDSIILLEDIDACIPSIINNSVELPLVNYLKDQNSSNHENIIFNSDGNSNLIERDQFNLDPNILEYNSESHVTLSGLLNALDGIHSQEDRIIFCTSNHPERLQPALIRPGRIDFRINLSYANEDQLKDLYKHFFEDATPELTDAFLNKANKKIKDSISPSGLSSYFLSCESAKEAIDRLDEIIQK